MPCESESGGDVEEKGKPTHIALKYTVFDDSAWKISSTRAPKYDLGRSHVGYEQLKIMLISKGYQVIIYNTYLQMLPCLCKKSSSYSFIGYLFGKL